MMAPRRLLEHLDSTDCILRQAVSKLVLVEETRVEARVGSSEERDWLAVLQNRL